jgi:2'-5' RNA ligase
MAIPVGGCGATPPGASSVATVAGAQPHVTVLFPFLAASALTPEVRATLAGIAARVDPFDVTFRRVRRFEEGVVWIEPEPGDPFRRLTAAVVERWPEHPPYDGLFDEVIPHLTIVEAEHDDPPLSAIEAQVAAALPFRARADRLELWRQDPEGRWRPHWRLPLGRSLSRPGSEPTGPARPAGPSPRGAARPR